MQNSIIYLFYKLYFRKRKLKNEVFVLTYFFLNIKYDSKIIIAALFSTMSLSDMEGDTGKVPEGADPHFY